MRNYKYMVDIDAENTMVFSNFLEMRLFLIKYFNHLEKESPRFYNSDTYAVRLYKRNSAAAIRAGNPEYFTCEVSLVRFNSLTSKDMTKLPWRYF